MRKECVNVGTEENYTVGMVDLNRPYRPFEVMDNQGIKYRTLIECHLSYTELFELF